MTDPRYKSWLNHASEPVQAEYAVSVNPDWHSNPYIMALSQQLNMLPFNERRRQVRMYIEDIPDSCTNCPEYQNLSAFERLTLTQNLRRFRTVKSAHLDLELRLSAFITSGYQDRNPLSPTVVREAYDRRARTSQGPPARIRPSLEGAALAVIGPSGSGKTCALKQLAQLYHQVILHKEFRGRPFTRAQVVWLGVNFPSDRSSKTLCKAIIRAFDETLSSLGTRYTAEYVKQASTRSDLQNAVIDIVQEHGLGMLIVDEAQLGVGKNYASTDAMDFLVELINNIHLPVLLAATPKAYELIGSSMKSARRVTGVGDMLWNYLQYSPSRGTFSAADPWRDSEWGQFFVNLWNIQYFNGPVEASFELCQTLYEISMGIPDVAIKVWMLAQMRFVLLGETIPEEQSKNEYFQTLIWKVASDSMHSVEPILRKMRSYWIIGAMEDAQFDIVLKDFDDIFIPDEYVEQVLKDAVKVKMDESQALQIKSVQMSNLSNVYQRSVVALRETGLEERQINAASTWAVESYPSGTDLKVLCEVALKHASGQSQSKAKSTTEAVQSQPLCEPSVIEGLGNQRKNGESVYEALKSGGLVLDLAELRKVIFGQ